MTHVLKLVEKKKSGYSEYLCPECGRHLLMCFDPYDKIVSQPGNETITHAGSGDMPDVNLGVGLDIKTKEDKPLEDWVDTHTNLFDWSEKDGAEENEL